MSVLAAVEKGQSRGPGNGGLDCVGGVGVAKRQAAVKIRGQILPPETLLLDFSCFLKKIFVKYLRQTQGDKEYHPGPHSGSKPEHLQRADAPQSLHTPAPATHPQERATTVLLCVSLPSHFFLLLQIHEPILILRHLL